MEELYAIRIDVITPNVIKHFADLLKDIEEFIVKGFIVQEKGKKTGKLHLQGILQLRVLSDKVLKNIRNTIVNKVLERKATKGDYSFCKVRKTEDEYMIYLCKGGEGCIEITGFEQGENIKILYQEGYTDEEICNYRSIALEQQRDFAISRLEKRKTKSIGQSLLEYLIAKEDEFLLDAVPQQCINHKQYCISKCGKYLDKIHLVKLIVRFFSLETKKFRSFLIEEFYNLVEHHYSPHTTEERICKDLEEKLNFKYVY